MADYTTVSNHAIDDDALAPAALGLLVWLLRQPTTTGLTVKKIQKSLSGIGEMSLTRSLRQLEARGYLKRVKGYEDGRFQTGEYVVTDSPEV